MIEVTPAGGQSDVSDPDDNGLAKLPQLMAPIMAAKAGLLSAAGSG